MAKRTQSRKNKGGNKVTDGPDLIAALISGIRILRQDPESRGTLRRVTAWSLLLACIFALIACISYFSSGRADQSITEGGAQNVGQIRNMLGYVGAWVADLIVRRGFGMFGLLIPLYGILISLVLMEDDYYFYARRLFKYAIFATVWGSAFVAYIIIFMDAGQHIVPPNYDLGGGVGYFLNVKLISYIGKLGVFLVLGFAMVMFVVVNFKTEVRASTLIGSLSALGGNVLPSQTAPNTKKINRPAKKKPSNHPLKQKLKQQMGISGNQKPAAHRGLTPVSLDGSPNSAPPVVETSPPEPVESGTQIRLDVTPPVIKPQKKKNPPINPEGPEFTIVETPEEVMPEAPITEAPQLKQLGEDNVGQVVGSEDKVMKIVPEADQETDTTQEVIDWEAFNPKKELPEYEPPILELLDDHGSGRNREVNRDELVTNKNKIVETLSHYGIEITNIKATIGPTVTLYEIVPAPGVRISKIRNLEDDIALSLAALGIRIIAPIPGKGTIGIEVPNSNREIVSLRGVLSTVKFQTTSYELPIAIGRTISNEVYIADLNKMPHLLIAGATGQGKSVGLNTIIASLLYKKHPAEVKLVLIDPKKVEMTLYQSLEKHFLAQMPGQKEPIITDVRDAVNVLKSLSIEMDQRYDLLKKARVRNLKEYNSKFTDRKLSPLKGHYFMPYIILVIDELADMMMTAGKEVEMPIARLAQLARAVGIHLVVATQRPSVNVITGIIKANFPARLSYRVISKVDSRTILDANGADQLIGRGDLLLSTGSDIIRLQNAFIDTPEVERLVDYISQQKGLPKPYYLPDLPSDDDGNLETEEPFERDSNFEEAARVIVRYQIGSASLIQRKLKLGYNRAGRIIDQLERAKIVGPHSGSKPREVLVQDEAELERYLNSLP